MDDVSVHDQGELPHEVIMLELLVVKPHLLK
jgi:hypothetical protein